MAEIGKFNRGDDGSLAGNIRTLTLNVKASIRPIDTGGNAKAPDYRVYAGKVAFGAGWSKTSREGRDYVALKLDDPSFPAPIYASLIDAENGALSLVWSR